MTRGPQPGTKAREIARERWRLYSYLGSIKRLQLAMDALCREEHFDNQTKQKAREIEGWSWKLKALVESDLKQFDRSK